MLSVSAHGRRTGWISAAVLLAIAGLPVSSAFAQSTYTLSAFTGGGVPWSSASSWSPSGGPPGAADTAIINNGPFPGHGLIDSGSAVAMDLIIGSSFRGWLDHSGGSLAVGNRITLGNSGGLGEYYMSGSATMTAHELYVGNVGGGFFLASGDADVTVDHMVVGAGPVSFYEKKATQTGDSVVRVHGALEVGQGGPATYLLRGGSLVVERALIGGPGSTGTGSLTLGPAASGDTPPLMLVDEDVQVGGGGGAGITGTLTNNGGTILSTSDLAEIFVNGAKGRLAGTGTFDIKVTYLNEVNIHFKKDSLKTAANLTVVPGLSAGNVGLGPVGDPTEIIDHLTPHMLAGSDKTITWSGTALPGAVNYVTTPGNPTIDVPCTPATATGTASVPAANVAGRVRLLQFGQRILEANRNGSTTLAGEKFGEIRNITAVDGVKADKVIGETPNISGDFSVGVIGTAVEPVHQNPDIAILHGPGYNLRGAGVVMGQMEPGVPDINHGCFEDWSLATGQRASVVAAGGGSTTGHATLVASLMVGHDPLGVQVDGQSRFEPAAHRYGPLGSEGFGFTGVAPEATLVSINAVGVPGGPDPALVTLATTPGMKVINQSAGYGGSSSLGTHPEELSIDHWVEEKGIVYVGAAGNDGPGSGTINTPNGAYNGITVGNAIFEVGTVNADYPRVFDGTAATTIISPSSSIGPTGDGRCKPDITAQGTDVLGAFAMEYLTGAPPAFQYDPAYPTSGNHGLYGVRQRISATTDRGNPGTSFSSPQVAGLAALMVEQARRNASEEGEHPLVIKSIMQTTADKPAGSPAGPGVPEVPGWHKGVAGAADDTGVPLDFRWGAGVMDPRQAIDLIDTEKIFHDDGEINRDGWSLSTLYDTDPLNAYGFSGHGYLLNDLVAGQPLTATLNWYKHVDASLMSSTLLNLDLRLYSWDGTAVTLLAALSSTSINENVEHIYAPSLAGGDYILRVSTGLFMDRASETYALSWDATFVPAPGVMGVWTIAAVCVVRRRPLRRA